MLFSPSSYAECDLPWRRGYVDFAPLNEPGWVGALIRTTAPGAWPSGTLVEKAVVAGPDDAHAVGARATVLGSFSDPRVAGGAIAYCVEWADMPKVAVFCMAYKLRLVPLH